MKTKTLIKLMTPFAIVGVIPTTLLLSSCSNSSGIIFANFESYMCPDVMDRAKANTNTPLQFVWCSTNEEIQSKFDRYYDVAIPSSYEVIPLMQKGELLPIDYSKFPSIQALGILPPLSPFYGSDMKTSGLLTDTVIDAIDTIDAWVRVHGDFPQDDLQPDPSKRTILDYGIPYFLQDWIMAYEWDEEITQLSGDLSWGDIAFVMGNNNPNRPDIFKPTNARKISIVDDNRSVYDMCSLYANDSDINPPSSSTQSDFLNTYQQFFNNFTDKNNFYFNTDSGQILQTLADPTIYNSGIAYNGDVLYAATGAGIYDNVWHHDNFHAVVPSKTMTAMDMVVINKKNQYNANKMDNIYKAVDTVAVNGMGVSDISATENDTYKYSAMENLDYILYTSPIKSIDDYVSDPGGYFKDDGYDDEFCNDLIKIYNIDSTSGFAGLIESPISDKNKSDMHWAYNTIKMYL